MEIYILLGLALIIVLIFIVSSCSLKCPCGNENYLRSLPFNDHPVLKRNRYRHTLASAPQQGLDENINTKASCDGSGCKCVLCDSPSPGKCISRTCEDMPAATNCCKSQDIDCPGCNANNDSSCDYQKRCKVNFNDGNGGGDGGDGDNSEKIWFIVGISVLVAVALGVAFYFWMTQNATIRSNS